MKAVLVLSASALALLGALAAVAAVRARRALGGSRDEALTPAELAGGRVAWVALATLPVLWCALRAEVAAWPGLTCVLGVTRLGTRAGGAAAALPWLLGATVALTCASLVATGAWMTLRRIDRATPSAPLARRATGWIAAAGLCAVGGGLSAVGWVAAPRDAPDVAAGCCTARTTDGAEPTPVHDRRERNAWAAAFVVTGTGAAAVLAVGGRRGGNFAPAGLAASVAAAAVASRFVPVSLAPARMGLPLHECAWCLLDVAPENWLGAAATSGAVASAAWACEAVRARSAQGAAAAADDQVRRLLAGGGLCAAVATSLGAAGRWLT